MNEASGTNIPGGALPLHLNIAPILEELKEDCTACMSHLCMHECAYVDHLNHLLDHMLDHHDSAHHFSAHLRCIHINILAEKRRWWQVHILEQERMARQGDNTQPICDMCIIVVLQVLCDLEDLREPTANK